MINFLVSFFMYSNFLVWHLTKIHLSELLHLKVKRLVYTCACMCVCRLVCVSACVCLCVHASTFMRVHACVYELMCVHDHSENLLAPKWKRKKLVSLDLCVYLSTGLTTFQSPKQFLLNDSHKKLVVCYVHHVF